MLLASSMRKLTLTLKNFIKLRKRPNPTQYSHNLASKGSSGVGPMCNTNSHHNNLDHTPTYLIRDPLRLLLLRPATSPSVLSADNPLNLLQRKLGVIFDSSPGYCPYTNNIRLFPFLSNWRAITNDTWVLYIIEHGYRLEFTELPPLGYVNPTSYNVALEEEVFSLL